jgi:hypothetical protein
LENVANLDKLPPRGATLIIAPIKIEGVQADKPGYGQSYHRHNPKNSDCNLVFENQGLEIT